MLGNNSQKQINNLKKLFGILAITATLLMLTTACDKKQKPETFISDKARPTWTASPSGDMTSSMTAVVKADLKTQYPEIATDFKGRPPKHNFTASNRSS